MIRAVKTGQKNRGIVFKEHQLAHQWCKGQGLELGASAHNPFNLPGSLNLAPGDDDAFYREQQIQMCGAYVEIDIVAEGDAIPVDDQSQDYIISSHVVEHFPNPLKAFVEWSRVLKPDGIIFMIVPKRDAHPDDRNRPVSSWNSIVMAYIDDYTVDDFPGLVNRRRGHYFVWTLELMLKVIEWGNEQLDLGWEVVATEASDSKVGNGFTVVCQKKG